MLMRLQDDRRLITASMSLLLYIFTVNRGTSIYVSASIVFKLHILGTKRKKGNSYQRFHISIGCYARENAARR